VGFGLWALGFEAATQVECAPTTQRDLTPMELI
jgi:hypothetical protein